MTETIVLPLFPLAAHLMPEGRMSLRIFEPRYKRMVRDVCESQTDFGICMLNSEGVIEDNSHIMPIGTVASVVDFFPLEDGLLGITVKGGTLFRIEEVWTEKDDLRVAKCKTLSPWKSDINIENHPRVSDKLMEVFKAYSEIGALYHDTQFNDADWVMLRWLELLPISSTKKQAILNSQDYSGLMQYLETLIKH